MALSPRQLIDAARAATAVRRPLRFFLRQLYSRSERVYTLRSGIRIVVRDRSRDVAIMAEIYSRHCYDLRRMIALNGLGDRVSVR